jgi:hypothetical protein
MVSDARPAPATAVEMARRQREISVSEFFLKNRHLLGFDTPAKALVTAVREAMDNALDACEEAGILPDITVQVQADCNGMRCRRRGERAHFRPAAPRADRVTAMLRARSNSRTRKPSPRRWWTPISKAPKVRAMKPGVEALQGLAEKAIARLAWLRSLA